MNINRIMVTGGRSPVALNLIRIFHTNGYKVFVAESEKYHLSKKTKAIEKEFIVPKPNEDYRGYIAKLLHHCLSNRINIIIPTCEEIFHISKAKEKFEENGIRVFTMDIDTLRLLHNKFTFNQYLQEHSYIAPETYQFTSKEALLERLGTLPINKRMVLKAVYSRFASSVMFVRKDTSLNDKDFIINPDNPWVLQDCIEGTQYCSYSIAIEGELVAHSCYPTIYIAGLGANVLFKNVDELQIEKFVETIVREFNFTGQIAFDFILDNDGVPYPIECNPRATSGLHLFNEVEGICDVFLNESVNKRIYPDNKNSYKLGLPLLLYGLSEGYLLNKPLSFIRDFISAKDVIYDRGDKVPYFYQAVFSGVMLYRKWKTGKSLTELTTTDIEWNGKGDKFKDYQL